MFGYQRVHHEQPCKAKTGKPTVTKIGDEGEHEELTWNIGPVVSTAGDSVMVIAGVFFALNTKIRRLYSVRHTQ